ncbi:MAG: hypothetical protein Q9175_001354 [Cornicularia normoerica]
MNRTEPGIANFPTPATFNPLQQRSTTSTAEPSMATEHQRYFGSVKTVNTTPPSLTIIPEDRTAHPDYALVFELSHIELSEFLYLFGAGEMRVSYVLRSGPSGVLLVEDVQGAEAVKVKEEEGSASGGSANGSGGVKVKKEKNVLAQIGFLASQHDRITLEEEARRNARGEFVCAIDFHRGGMLMTDVASFSETGWAVSLLMCTL